MGWEGYHLYRFDINGMEYGDPSMVEEMEGEDARRVTLEALVQGAKDKFLYEYDFGDSWDHELLVEKVLPYEAGQRYPVCLTGKRACPPEDCGGIWGYAAHSAPLGWRSTYFPGGIFPTHSTPQQWYVVIA